MPRLSPALAVLLLILAHAVPAAGQAPPAGAVRWIDDPAKAVAVARRIGQPIVAYFTYTNCGYCRKMERDSWSGPAIARAIAAGFVPLRFDAQRNPAEVTALRVRAYPTTVLLTPDGAGFAGAEGYLPPVKLAALLRSTQRPAPLAVQPVSR